MTAISDLIARLETIKDGWIKAPCPLCGREWSHSRDCPYNTTVQSRGVLKARGGGKMSRNMVEAIKDVMEMSDERIRLFAEHDPDIFREISQVASELIAKEPFGNPPCEDCWPDGRCSMNCSGAIFKECLRSYNRP